MGRRARTTSLRRLRGASALAIALAIVALCLACAPMASAAGVGAGAKRTFPDVNATTPHAEDITWLAETSISTGFPDGTFRGDDAVTRQDMAAFLRRLARLMGDESAAESKKYTCSFTDVTDATPHADDIAWLAETGISTGYPDNTFRGMAAVCRQDMAAFLRRLAARVGVGDAASWDGEPGGFPDVGATADHAADIAWLAATGVSTGYPDGTFRGMAAVARQDMAAFLHRLHKLPQDGPGEPPSYAEWAARMVNALENDDASPDVSEENLADAWNEAKRIGIVPFDVEDRDAVATRDFALCCAALTCGFTDEGIESDAPDASASQHPALIDAAIKAGIGEADPDGKVRPGDAITGSEADAAEARVQELLATPATSEPMSSWKPAPGVEEIPDAVADGERYIVPVPASDIKTGDKVILEPSDAMPLGAAGTVQSVEDAGAGNARIAIKQATSLDEVFDEVHVEAINVPLELGVAARAAGLDERSNERISGAYEIPFSYHPSEEVSIDGNITVSATLKIDWKKGLAPSRVTAVLSPSASLKVEAVLEQDFDGVEISLLPVDLSIPLGITGASIDFNATLSPSLNGHLSLSTSAHFSAGVDYFDGHFRAVRDAGIDLPELEGELTFDLGPNAGFAFFGIDIASIQPKIIPGIWGRMNFRETGMVCSDVAAYVGMGLTGKLDILDPFSAFIDNTFDFVQIGREETPLKWDLHWENGRLVPECTVVCKAEDAYCTLYDDWSLVISSSSKVDTSKNVVSRWRGLGGADWYHWKDGAKSCQIEGKIQAPVDCDYLFSSSCIKRVDLEGLDTSNTYTMEGMFRNSNIESIDLTCLNLSQVHSIRNIFYNCNDLRNVNLDSCDTRNVTDMSAAFLGTTKLKSISLKPLNLSSLNEFDDCFFRSGIESIDMSNMNLSRIRDMTSAFYRCNNLKYADFDNSDLSNLASLAKCFSHCQALEEASFANIKAHDLYSLRETFYGCPLLKRISFDGAQIGNPDTDYNDYNAFCFSDTFNGCKSLRSASLNLTSPLYCYTFENTFKNCAALHSVDLSSLKPTENAELTSMFSGCTSLAEITGMQNWELSSQKNNMNGVFDGCPAPRPPWYTEMEKAA